MKYMLCVDGSEPSFKALEFLARMAKKGEDHILVMSLWTLPSEFISVRGTTTAAPSTPTTPSTIKEGEEEGSLTAISNDLTKQEIMHRKNYVQNLLFESKIRLEALGLSAKQLELKEEVTEDVRVGILEAAARENVDSIVVGSRGLNAIKRMLLGSVSNYLVNNADRPVLVVR
ncbi:Universal stress domain containing protein [Balamuthia mandrillaris]